MRTSDNDPDNPTATNVWVDELLVSTANLGAYQLVYEGETWVRRICLAAYMLTEGPAWASSLDGRLRRQLESRSRNNSEYWYLGVDTEEELLWTSSLGQLASVLRTGTMRERVKDLCGVGANTLADTVEGVSRIRNALAHNRAISEDSLTVLKSHLRSSEQRPQGSNDGSFMRIPTSTSTSFRLTSGNWVRLSKIGVRRLGLEANKSFYRPTVTSFFLFGSQPNRSVVGLLRRE